MVKYTYSRWIDVTSILIFNLVIKKLLFIKNNLYHRNIISKCGSIFAEPTIIKSYQVYRAGILVSWDFGAEECQWTKERIIIYTQLISET